MPDIEFGLGAQELDKLINIMGKIDKATLKAAISAVGLGKNLDNSAKKGKKSVSSLDKGVKQVGSNLIALAGPAAIFATFIAGAKADIEAMINKTKAAAGSNATFNQSFSKLTTNNKNATDKELSDLKDFLLVQGSKKSGLINTLPQSFANIQSGTGTLGSIDLETQKVILEEAVKQKINDSETDIEGFGINVAKLVDVDKRKLTKRQKVNSSINLLSQFKSDFAGTAESAEKILPRALALPVSAEESLALTAFGSKIGDAEGAKTVEALKTIFTTLLKDKKVNGKKQSFGRGTEGLLNLLKQIQSGALGDKEKAIADFAGGNGSVAAFLNEASVSVPVINKFIKGNQASKAAFNTSAVDLNSEKLLRQSPTLAAQREADREIARSEVAEVLNTEESNAGNKRKGIEAFRKKLGNDLTSDSFLGFNPVAAEEYISTTFGSSQAEVLEKRKAREDESLKRDLTGRNKGYFQRLKFIATSNLSELPEEERTEELRKFALNGGIRSSDGLDAQERGLIRRTSPDEDLANIRLSRFDAAENAGNTERMAEILEKIFEEIKAGNETRKEGNQDRKLQANKSTPGEDDI